MSGAPDIRVLEDPAGEAAALLVRHASAGSHIALTGGSTPADAYARAAAADADWSSATLWFGDERCVAPDDQRSNYLMAKRALLDRLPGDPPAVERILGELGPDAGADDYAERLGAAFGGGPVVLDLILLGLGSDGHCASLFPGRPEVGVTDRVAVGVPEAGLEPFVPRVTLTLPTINAGREVVFLVTGAGKAEAAARAWGGTPDPDTPASLVAPASGTLTVLIDPAAAERLP
ncbi:MAG: 6-phosphogluconolactonase [Solirubrobacteraceae bacterium]|jgi:6-phosphogluconolactonase|nr:6-phosphogluconolactonase [Solirubrobacteraceae bacterium]